MSTPPRVLIVRRRYLGDVILLGRLLRDLRAHWPEARLSLVVEPAYAEAAELHPPLDEIIRFPRRLRDWLPFVRRLRAPCFTHVLNLDNNDKGALITRLTAAPARLALDRADDPVRWRRAYTRVVPVTNPELTHLHITGLYHRLADTIGVPRLPALPRLAIPAREAAAAQKLIHGPGPRIALHPGTRSEFRRWPADRFAAVCDRVQDELDARIFLIGGRPDRAFLDAVRQHATSHLVSLRSDVSVAGLAALFAACDLVLCHDSGPMHIAAAAGTRVVALYGSQNLEQWRPLGEGHQLLQAPLPCRDCVSPGECIPHEPYFNRCVRRLSVDDVVAAIRRALAPPSSSSPAT